MKRIILLVVLLLGVQALYAQRSFERYPKTELSLSYSIYPRVAAERFLDAHYQAITGGFYSGTGYQGNQVHSTGVITGEIAFKLKNWLAVGVQLAGESFWANTVNSVERLSATALFVLPNVRFTYVRSEVFRMYSGVGAGLGVFDGFSSETSYYAGIGGAEFDLAFQVVPVGIHFGRDVYGIAEVSLGTMNMGLRAGIGYCF